MASLLTLRGLVYTYLGTSSADPMYPPATITALLNSVANKYAAEVQAAIPAYMSAITTLTSTTNSYALPADFAGYVEVRLNDAKGWLLEHVRFEELIDIYGTDAFAITGADQAATLTTTTSVLPATPLYLSYTTQPVELAADADVPSWMPTQWHELLAREAAIDGFGLGSEGAPSPQFVRETEDRRAMFWAHIGKRGVKAMRMRL